MPSSLKSATWPEINDFREAVTAAAESASCLCDAAQAFARLFAERFETVVLARVFAVVPFERLPAGDQAFAQGLAERVSAAPRLAPLTPVLSLLGTHGVGPSWNERRASAGHLAIPLMSRDFVEGIPMIAQLLAELEVDLSFLDEERPIASRPLLGSSNSQCFYVANASEARDARDRLIISSPDFVARYGVQTVFGMGGSYLDGTMLTIICFTREALERLVVDRFPSILANFRMATKQIVESGQLYPP